MWWQTCGGRHVVADIEMLSVVALLEDLPEVGLVRGQVGAVFENWAPGVYESSSAMTTAEHTLWLH
jgi:hypothetical protein